ncbi:hypothetical protein NUW58_g6259 [Xylaria curta]|uniref:Uncharacterized protein n=1 Tax=Xylaria curta TaxID=42375 RepID=A0ACC1NWT9_9PEZI|nr:hypothetical protein NUW58_g6259 [Xylaria curta]
MASFSPTQIFEEGTIEEKGENARLAAFVGAIAVGDLVKSTLGPKGMDKILQSASTQEMMVTNDGATILKSIALDNAAAKVLVNISKVQDDEVGDGTTSVTVLAAELLREAEKLAALQALEQSAVDHSKNPEAFKKDLLAIARTTLSSKVLAQDRDLFAKLAVEAVLRLKGSSDLSHIQIIKKAGGKLSDSYLDEGFILDKKIGVNQPKRLEKAKILVANTSMDTDKVKIFGARFQVSSTSKLAELERAEKEKMKAKVEKIKAHGINCFINRQLIYNWPEQLFTDAGIIEGVQLEDRKIKRGWTTTEQEMIEEKRKRAKDGRKDGKSGRDEKKDKKDKKKRTTVKSKYTDEPECLFKTKLPGAGPARDSEDA